MTGIQPICRSREAVAIPLMPSPTMSALPLVPDLFSMTPLDKLTNIIIWSADETDHRKIRSSSSAALRFASSSEVG
jgi:hypothetical protein